MSIRPAETPTWDEAANAAFRRALTPAEENTRRDAEARYFELEAYRRMMSSTPDRGR